MPQSQPTVARARLDQPRHLRVQCAIAGGGPAGMVLGFLLARAGIEVVVLEKHADFLRDFRGDTIHPSTLELLHELGLLEDFLQLPHQVEEELQAEVGDLRLTFADFRHLPTRCKFIAFMPQWDFLQFFAERAAALPTFRLELQAEAVDLMRADGRVSGIAARTPHGALEVQADLVVAADGRGSVLRERAGLLVRDLGAPMDVLWFRLPRAPADPPVTTGRFDAGQILIEINRGDYWQCAYLIPKGSLEDLRTAGLAAFQRAIRQLMPFVGERVRTLASWDDIRLLTVRVDRLAEWCRPGLLCIGDAAHAMSPIGGVGINLAIQDAVAAANRLAPALAQGVPDLAVLRQVQRRRIWPTAVTQRLQLLIQRRIIARVLGEPGSLRPPWPLRLLARVPWLRRLPARLIGLGIRPEHVDRAWLAPSR